MATSIGGVGIDLRLQSASFQRDMTKATQALRNETAKMRLSLRSLEQSAGLVTKGLGALGIGFGIKEIASFAMRAFEAGAGLGELAEQIGVSTDALQIYQFAAVQSGVKTEELQTALMRLTRSLGEAEKGNANIIKAFKDMGVSTVDVAGKALKTEQVLEQMADAYRNAGNKAEFAANAAEVGGRSFQKMLPILAGGKDGLDGWAASAREAGVVLDKEVIQRLDQASDRIERFWFSFRQHATRAIAAVISAADELDLSKSEKELAGVNEQLQLLAKNGAPAGLIRSFQEQKKTLEAYIATLKKAAAPPAPGGVGIDESVFGGRGKPLNQTTEPQKKFNEEIDRRIAALKEEAALVGMSARALFVETEARRAQTAAASQQVELSTQRLDQLRAEAGALFDAKTAEDARAEAMKRFTAELEADSEAWKKRAEIIDAMPKSISFDLQREAEDLKRLTEAAQKSNKAYETEVELLDIRNKLRAAGLPSGDREIEQYRTLAEDVGDWKDQLKDAQDRLSDMKDASRDFAHVIGTAFEDAILEGKKFSDVLRALYMDIERIALRMFVTKPLENALTGAMGGGSGDIFSQLFGSGGGGLSGSVGRSGGWFGDLFNATGDSYGIAEFAPAFAHGTDSAPPGWAWTGEEGPELVRFRGGETVVPHDESMRMAGGAQITQHVYVQGRIDDRSLTQMERASAKGASRGGRR